MTGTAKSLKAAMVAAAIVFFCGGEAAPAPDQLRGADLGFDADKPIAVNADNFLADLKGNFGTYTGNVLVAQGMVKLHADEVVVRWLPGGKASLMEAKGHVIVDSPSGEAVGDNGVYDVAAQNLHLTGHVVLTRDANVMRGSELQIAMDTGIATLTAAPQNPGETQGRVQGLFVPAAKADAQASQSGGAANSPDIKQPQQNSGQK